MQITEATCILNNQQNYNKHGPLAQDIVSLSGENYFIRRLSYKKSDAKFTASEGLTAKVHSNNGTLKHKNQTPSSLTNVNRNEFSKICLFYATDLLEERAPKATSDILIPSTSISSCDDSDKSKPVGIRNVTFCDENGVHDMMSYSMNYKNQTASMLPDKIYLHDNRGIASLCGLTKADKLCLYDHTNTSTWKSCHYNKTSKTRSGILTRFNALRNVKHSDLSRNIDKTIFHNENDICEFIPCSKNQKATNDELIPFFKPGMNINQFYANEYPLPVYKNTAIDIQINGYLTNNFNHNVLKTFHLNLKPDVLENMCLNTGLLNANIVSNNTNCLLLNIFKHLNNNQILQIQDNTEGQCNLLSTMERHDHPSAILALSLKSENMPKYYRSLIKKHVDDKQLCGTNVNLQILFHIQLENAPKDLSDHTNLLTRLTTSVRTGNHLLALPAHMSTGTLHMDCVSTRSIADVTCILADSIFNKALKTESLKTSSFPENKMLPSQSHSFSQNKILLNKSMWFLKMNHSLSTRNVIYPASLPNIWFSERKKIQPVTATRKCLNESEDKPSSFVGTIYIWSMLILFKAMVNAFA